MASKIYPIRLLFVVAVMTMYCVRVCSQGMTYNHDPVVCETFESNSALLEGLRAELLIPLQIEKPHAEKIDSSLNNRKRVEELNIADRTPQAMDFSWTTEKKKVETKLAMLKKGIDRITIEGGSSSDYTQWIQKYNALLGGLQAVRDAYMPSSKRKEQYLMIYDDIMRQNIELSQYLVWLRSRKLIKKYGDSGPVRMADFGTCARSAFGRWAVALATASRVSH